MMKSTLPSRWTPLRRRGKSTLAKAIAAKLGILYVDTGAIYRTIGYAVKRRGIEPRDEAAVRAILPELEIGMRYEADGEQHMLLNGQCDARDPAAEISMYASAVSALPCVRAFLLEMQRDLARKHSVIMDRRDIGTVVVLPDAEVKIFLTASAEVRAQRRCLELEQRGTPKGMTRCCVSSMSGTTTTPTAPPRRAGRRRTQWSSIPPRSISTRAGKRCSP